MENPQNIAEQISQIADQRREKLRLDLEKGTTPEFITQIIQTETSFVFHPNGLPYAQADLEKFSQSLKDLYGLTPIEDRLPANDPLAKVLGQRNRDALEFKNGRFKVSSHDLIQIKLVRMTLERLHVALLGQGAAAEVIIADIVERLWASAGVSKPWSDISKLIQARQYGTATEVNLGFPLQRLLSPDFAKLIEAKFLVPGGFAREMAPKRSSQASAGPQDILVGYVVDEVKLLFTIVDIRSGVSERPQLRISVGNVMDYGTTNCVVISELPYDTHVKCVSALIDAFADG
jgi:hypothetical protein